MVSREKIHELVKLINPPTYRTFYINSEDGKEFTKPIGVFVSLGMTTSLDTLMGVCNLIKRTTGYDSILVELSSIKVGDQFLNTIVNKEDPEQYRLADIPGDVMGKEETEEELRSLESKINPQSSLETITEYSPRLTRLQRLYNILGENGWESHGIQRVNNEYRIYHLFVNYKKKEGIEYRLGIFVYEQEEDNH